MLLWNELEMDIAPERLLVRHPRGFRVCSSALWMGGLTDASAIANLRVPSGYGSEDPGEDARLLIRQWGGDPVGTVGLLTAAQVEEAGVVCEQGRGFQLCAVVTAGVGNAVRAGESPRVYPAYRPGTINIIVVVDGRMTDAALVNAVQTATEAKAAVLQDLDVRDERGGIATGTSTDAVVIACTNNTAYDVEHPYAGSATEIGDALARAVRTALTEAIRRERRRKGGDVS